LALVVFGAYDSYPVRVTLNIRLNREKKVVSTKKAIKISAALNIKLRPQKHFLLADWALDQSRTAEVLLEIGCPELAARIRPAPTAPARTGLGYLYDAHCKEQQTISYRTLEDALFLRRKFLYSIFDYFW